MTEMKKVTDGVTDVIVYPSAMDKAKNRGFAFVEYESHRTAAMARRKLIPGRIQLWGHQIAVDWAEPEQDVDDDVMNKVKILYVRNLMLSTTEETLLKAFNKAAGLDGAIERVKKLKDYAFVHFRDRDLAIKAMNIMNGALLENSRIEVVLAKPVDKTEYQRYARQKLAFPSQNDGNDVTDMIEAFNYNMSYAENGSPGAGFGEHVPTDTNIWQDCWSYGRGCTRIDEGRGRGAGHQRWRGPGAFVRPPFFHRTPVEILEDLCQKNSWGTPNYQLFSIVQGIGRDGSSDMQLFLYKVTIPGLTGNVPFQPNKVCSSIEEAKSFAAEFVLHQLAIPTEGSGAAGDMYGGRPFAIPMSIPMPGGIGAPPPVDVYTGSIIKLPPPSQVEHFYQTSYPPPPPVSSMPPTF